MSRSKAQREQDRADLLAALEDADGPMWTEDIIGAALGLRPGQYPGTLEGQRGYTDLRALARQGLVVCERRTSSYSVRWALAGDTALTTRRDEHEDVDDLRRQMAAWVPAEEEETAS